MTDLSTERPLKFDPRYRCSRVKNNGDQCRNPAIRGGSVCHKHGGSAPQVRAAANRRLEELVQPAIREHLKILERDDVNDADKLRAIAEVYDRTTYPKTVKQAIDATVDAVINDQSAQARSLAEMIEHERARIQARQTTVKRMDRP